MVISNNQLQKITLFIWSAMLVVAVVAMFFLKELSHKIDQERSSETDNLHLIETSYKLKYYDDYLTDESRGFVVTANIKHLQNYWNEVLINQNRDKLINDLRQHELSKNKIQLLVEAKQNSDILVQTEARAMKLVLLAYEVSAAVYPQYLKEFRLSLIDTNLPAKEKVKKAQDLLFNKDYFETKALITNPIKIFNEKIQHESKFQILERQKQTRTNIIILYCLLFSLVFLLVIMVWMKILLLQRLQNEV